MLYINISTVEQQQNIGLVEQFKKTSFQDLFPVVVNMCDNVNINNIVDAAQNDNKKLKQIILNRYTEYDNFRKNIQNDIANKLERFLNSTVLKNDISLVIKTFCQFKAGYPYLPQMLIHFVRKNILFELPDQRLSKHATLKDTINAFHSDNTVQNLQQILLLQLSTIPGVKNTNYAQKLLVNDENKLIEYIKNLHSILTYKHLERIHILMDLIQNQNVDSFDDFVKDIYSDPCNLRQALIDGNIQYLLQNNNKLSSIQERCSKEKDGSGQTADSRFDQNCAQQIVDKVSSYVNPQQPALECNQYMLQLSGQIDQIDINVSNKSSNEQFTIIDAQKSKQ